VGLGVGGDWGSLVGFRSTTFVNGVTKARHGKKLSVYRVCRKEIRKKNRLVGARGGKCCKCCYSTEQQSKVERGANPTERETHFELMHSDIFEMKVRARR